MSCRPYGTRWLGLLPIAMLAACALSAPPADETLRPTAGSAASADGIEALAQQALAAARGAPDDAAAQVAAAQRLFLAAELRMQQAASAWLRQRLVN